MILRSAGRAWGRNGVAQTRLVRLEQHLDAAQSGAKSVAGTLNGLRKKAQTGALGDIERQLEQVGQRCEEIARIAGEAAEAYRFDAASYFESGGYRDELKAAAEACGLVLVDRDGRLSAFPNHLRIDARAVAVRPNRRMERRVRCAFGWPQPGRAASLDEVAAALLRREFNQWITAAIWDDVKMVLDSRRPMLQLSLPRLDPTGAGETAPHPVVAWLRGEPASIMAPRPAGIFRAHRAAQCADDAEFLCGWLMASDHAGLVVTLDIRRPGRTSREPAGDIRSRQRRCGRVRGAGPADRRGWIGWTWRPCCASLAHRRCCRPSGQTGMDGVQSRL